MKKIIILPFAEEDIKQSTEYYKDKEDELDKQFLRVINQAFQIILINPNSFPALYQSIRKFVIKDFPFNIFYVSTKHTVYILAVFHTKRDPKKWRKRISR